MPIRLSAKIKPFVDDAFKLVDAVDIDGEIALDQVVAAIRDGSIVLPDETTGVLPDAGLEANQGRIAVSGNHMLQSLDHGAVDQVVTFKRYGPTRVVLTGEPARSSQEDNFQGAFNVPPDISAYDASDFLWDRGSQVWLFKQNQNDATWRGFGGPAGFAHGSLYSTEALAAQHVSETGKVYVIGQGSGQHVFIVTTYTAATDENWQWDPLGVTLGDVQSALAAHNIATDAHDDIRTEINTDVSAHNSSGTAHNDIRSDVSDVEDRLDALDPVEIEAYDSTATYARGSANSLVTHSNGLFIYISATERSSGHDPDNQPGYWLELSEGVTYEVISSGSHRIAARTLVVNGDNDNVYLCTTTQTTPRDLTYIHAQSESVGGAFILLNGAGSGGGFMLRQGMTAPASSLGDDGDWYLRTSNGQWYEKASGAWVSRYTDQLGMAGGGLTAVSTSTALTGDGTSSDPLDIADGGVDTTELADDAVTGDKIADNTIHGGALIDGTIPTGKIGDDQVTGAKLSDNAVSTGKVADDAITQAKIADDAVDTDQIADEAVTQTKLGEFSVVTGKIANNQVTTAKIANDAVTTAKLADNAAGEGKVPIDNTLQFDGSGNLGVEISTVIDLLDEDIRYYSTDTTREDARQASKGVVFLDTSRYAKRIHSVEWDFEGDGVGHNYTTFLVRIDSSDDIDFVYGESETLFNVGTSGTRRFNFDSSGLRIPGSIERLGLFITRTGSDDTWETKVYRGQPASDSPRESYPDASVDFPFWRSARFASGRPEPGDHIDNYITNGEIYGYPKIRYTLELEHASLVGDGNITPAHIDSGSSEDGTVLTADGSGGSAFEAVDAGLSESEVDARVTAGVLDFAETGNTDNVPVDKIPGSLTHRQAQAVTVSGSTLTIPTEDSVQGGDTVLFVIPTPWSVTGNLTARVSQGGNIQASTTLALNDRVGTRLTGGDVVAEEEMEIILATDWRSLVHPVGTGAAFDLHEDVTTAISSLDENDRFVVSDENLSGDPNRYVTLASVATKLAGTNLTASAGVLSASGGGAIEEFDSTQAYSKGAQAWTGTGAAFTVWTANQDISANSTTPTRDHPQDWIIESGPGSIRGLLSDIDVNVMRRGDIFWLEETGGEQKVYFTRTAGSYTTASDYQDADDFIELTTSVGPLAPAYSSTALYELGGSNSLVTFQNQLYFYSSSVSRSSNHSPETHPDYWIDLSTVANWISLNETDSVRIPGGTFVILPHDSSVYLSRDDVDSTAERNAAWVRSHAGQGEQFILVSPSGISWGFQIDTVIVPELNQDAITDARIVLEDSGLTHYLTFLDWTESNLDMIDHLPVGAHIGLRQGTTTRILEVAAEWDSTNERYQVTNFNTGILTEAASGTATELLLTAGAGGGTTVEANPTGSDGDDLTRIAIDGTNYNVPESGGTATGFTELRAPATLDVAQTWTATGATIPAADGDEWVRMNGNFDGEVPENFEFLSSRLRSLAEHLVGGSTSTGDVERLQFHDGSVFQRVLMARTADNELILRHEASTQSLGNLSVYSYSSIAGDGDIIEVPLTDADKNFAFTSAAATGQNRELFDSDVTLPTDIGDHEVFILRVEGDSGENNILLTKVQLDALTAVTPVTWASQTTNGVTADQTGDDKNALLFPLGQNRGLFLGISNETPYRLQWGASTPYTFTMQLIRMTAGAADSDLTDPLLREVASAEVTTDGSVVWTWEDTGITKDGDNGWDQASSVFLIELEQHGVVNEPGRALVTSGLIRKSEFNELNPPDENNGVLQAGANADDDAERYNVHYRETQSGGGLDMVIGRRSNGNIIIAGESGGHTYTVRVLSLEGGGGQASEEGQESPGGVSSLTAGYVHTLFYKYDETKPSVHAANWRFNDEWSNTDGPSTDSWYEPASDALTNAALDPDFVEADNTLWECRGRFRRRLNTDGDAYIYSDSKEVFAVFGEEFSEDAEAWHGTQTDDDIWQRIREPGGDWGTPTYIGPAGGVDWEILRSFTNVYSTSVNVPVVLSMASDLTQYRELRFRSYGLASGVTRRAPIIENVLTRPASGWPVDNDDAGTFEDDKVFQWRYGAVANILNIGHAGDMETSLTSHVTQEVVDPVDINTIYVVTIQAGGRFKFYSADNSEDDVDSVIFFDHPGTYQRVRFEISGKA